MKEQIYISYDDDKKLAKDRIRARNLCLKYNNKKIKNGKNNDILNELFKTQAQEYNIIPPFHCDYGYNIHIGKNVIINFNCCIIDSVDVYIGDNCMIAPNVSIFTPNHKLEDNPRVFGGLVCATVNIGNNVWIGGNSVILPGVSIGNNSIIGAGSVVNKDVPSNVIVAGNPARIIKKLSINSVKILKLRR